MALKVHPLNRLLEVEGSRGSNIPYLGYVEVNLQIPGIEGYNEDILLLVIPTMTYAEKVLVMLGSKIIDRVMKMITEGELVRATMTWRQAPFVWLCLGHFSCPTEQWGGRDAIKGVAASAAPNPMVQKEFSMDNVQGDVHTTQRVTFLPLGPSTYTATQTSEDIACGSTCSLSQHGIPSCLLLWSWPLQTGSYILAPPGCQSVEEPQCLPHGNPHQSSHW